MSLSWFESISRRRRACGKRKSNELISDKKQKNSRCASSSEEAANSRIIQCNKSINPPTLTLNENVLKAYVVEETEMLAFFKLLGDSTIKKFLDCDVCFKVADNFSIACVFAYFKRCDLAIEEYNRMNFFCCLYLVHDIEEDDEDYKYEILPWALGSFWKNKLSSFLRQREALWARMNYRAIVSYRCCKELMSIIPSHPVWERNRLPHHGEAIRRCSKPSNSKILLGPKSTPKLCNKCLLFYTKKKDLKEIVPNQAIFTPDITPNSNDSAFHSLLEGDSFSNFRSRNDLTTNVGLQSLCECAGESWLSQETYCHDKDLAIRNEYFVSDEE
uniref:Speedy protein A n=1 Tax=Trichobilharzia regenti TaxID=157069 RepID=A0AA85K370_TRIRE|nr:unnamed protein product [Trichobilharzia regenti]